MVILGLLLFFYTFLNHFFEGLFYSCTECFAVCLGKMT
jgi:hypothetical protein